MSNHQKRFDTQEPEETGLARPVSRRCFFSLTAVVGTLIFQGSALGGRVVAYADEAGHSHFSIYILSKYEVPVVVCDESGEKPQILSGAKVTLTSAVTGATVSGVTRDDGFVPLNVKALSYQKDHDDSSVFNFWGSAEVELEGYRSFYVQSMFIEAGTPADDKGNRTNVVHLNTQKDDGQPYLRSLTLDGADIMYVAKASARAGGSNTVDHDLVVQVCTPEPGQKMRVAILINGKEAAAQDQVSGKDEPYIAKVTFTDKWMQKIQIGDKLSVRYGDAGAATSTVVAANTANTSNASNAANSAANNTTKPSNTNANTNTNVNSNTGQSQADANAMFEFVSPLTFEAPVLLNERGTGKALLSPTSSNSGDEEQQRFLPMPEWFTRKGDAFSVDIPLLPMSIFFDDDGNFGFSFDLTTVNFIKRKDGKDLVAEEGRVHTFLGDTGMQAWDNYWKDVKETWKNYKGVWHDTWHHPDQDPSIGVGKISTEIDVSFHFIAKAQGYTEKDKQGKFHSTADLVLIPQFQASFSATQQIQVGFIPLFWTFDASADAMGKFLFGIEFEDWLKNINWSHHTALGLPAVPSFVFCIHIEVGLSLGIGVAGILSAAIRGYGYLNFDFNFTNIKGKPFPLKKIHAAAGAQVKVQALFFTKTVQIKESKQWKLLDNTEDKNLPLDEATNITSTKFDPSDAISDSDLTHVVESAGVWAFANAEDNFWPSYDVIAAPTPSVDMAAATFIDPATANDDSHYNPINGLRPSVQEVLWDGAFTNPRMRIVHTDTKSFLNDRAFLVRVAAVNIEVPKRVSSFGSGAWYEDGQATNAVDLGIQDIDGNQFVRPLDQVTNAANGTTVTRTRITISEWNKTKYTWDEAHVVDFIASGEVHESDRLNSHDIDFDLELRDGAIYLAITSLKRPEKPGATFEEYMRSQYVSLVRWDINKKRTMAAGSAASHLGTGKSLFHPRILMQQFDVAGRKDQMCAVVYSFACTYDKDGDVDTCNIAATVFDDLASETFSNHRLSNPTNILSKDIEKDFAIDPQTLSEGTFEVSCPDRTMTLWDEESGRNQSTVVLSWSHPATETVAATSFVTSQTYSIVIDKSSGAGQHKSYVTQHDFLKLEEIPEMVKLGNMDQKGLFSYADTSSKANTKPLSMVTYDKNTRKLGRIPSTGNTDKLKYFSSFNGRRLYTVRIMDSLGDNTLAHPGIPEDFRETVQDGASLYTVKSPYNSPNAMMTKPGDMEGGKVKLYQLLEARWVDELQTYFDFYPIAQLTVMPENIGVISVTKTRTDFTFSYVREGQGKNETADIYQAAVPAITVGQTGEASAKCPFAAPGDLCWYNIDITNVGNTPITEMTLQITDASGKEVAKTTYTDLAPYVQSSVDNVKAVYDSNGDQVMDENGLVAAERIEDKRDAKGILWPGKTRSYCFNFKVPEGYEKDVTFNVNLVEAKDNMEELSQFAEFHDIKADANDGSLLISPADFVQESNGVSLAPLTFDDPAAISFSVDNGEQKEYPVDYKEEREPIKVGEEEGLPWGAIGVGAAALGLAAAALTSYSNRRVENEAEAAEEARRKSQEAQEPQE